MDANTNSSGIQTGQRIFFRALGTTYKVLSSSVHGGAAIVDHTVEPGCIGAPMHKHTHEDEISYVLEGRLSAIQDGTVETAEPGQYLVKPRGKFHTFWNAENKRVRFVEVITPGNFESYFAEIAPYLIEGKAPQIDKLREVAAKYSLITDPVATEEIIKRFGLKQMG